MALRKLRSLLVLCLGGLTAGGCGVERQMTVRSDPPGALVYLNGEEVGRTPLTRDFLWYGKYDVQLRKEGYQTVRTGTNVTAPWWQWVPFDLVAELMPVRLKDRHTLSYAMKPASTQPADASQMLQNAADYRGKLESSHVATRPTSGPTTRRSK
jgi:hypothetical protein